MNLTLSQAEYIAAEFQFLKGLDFRHPKYGKCDIDFVEPYRRKNASYGVMLKNDIFQAAQHSRNYEFHHAQV